MNNILANRIRDVVKGKAEHASALTAFFAPRAVAIIGASPKPGNLGKAIVENLLAQKYGGVITTVHPKGLAMPSCAVVTDIAFLPEDTGLAIAAVSAENVLQLVEPLAKKGISHLIVISGGFAEIGDAGKNLQEQLRLLGRKFAVRIIGPNCMGTFSAPDRFNSFFLSAKDITLPKPGPLGLISQSGAFLSMVFDQLSAGGIGVHRAVNFGNRIDLGECEIMEEFGRDSTVKVIGMYLESIQSGPRFLRIAREIARVKPIVILKGGRGEKGNRATQAHSASLAGSYEVFQAVCAQTGIIETHGLGEFIDALGALALQPAPKGNRTLIVSNGGGMGVMLTDLCEQAGFSLPEPSARVQEYLRTILPSYYSFKNPIDLTGSGTNEQCALAVKRILDAGEYDCLLMVLLSGTEGINAEIAPLLRTQLPKNITTVIGAYGRNLYSALRAELIAEGIPVLPSGEAAAQALNVLMRSRPAKPETPSLRSPVFYNNAPTRGWLGKLPGPPDEMQIKRLLTACGISTPPRHALPSITEVCEAAREIGFPMVLKAVNANIKHKSEMQGVALGLDNETELLWKWQEMCEVWPGQVWAEKQMPPGLDLMVGAHRDPTFGPVLVFGSGGKYMEIYRDIGRVALPATDAELLRMVHATRAAQILRGVRGDQALDVERLIALLKWTADWMVFEPGIESLDFNPVRLYENNLVALDAKITVRL